MRDEVRGGKKCQRIGRDVHVLKGPISCMLEIFPSCFFKFLAEEITPQPSGKLV